MKKILSILLVLIAFISNAQDPNPLPSISVKKLISPNNPTFYYDQSDSLVKMFKGAYEWTWLIGKSYSDRYLVPYDGANRDVHLNTHSIATSGVKFNTTNPLVVSNPGEIGWDAADGTLDLRLLNNTTLQMGQESYFYGKAIEPIANGDPVMIAGVQGNHLTFKKAIYSELANYPQKFLGIATQNIATNDFGYVTWFGKVHDTFTTGWAAGDNLYFDPITNLVTNVLPNAPYVVIRIGSVIELATGAAENGTIGVRPTFGIRLQDLNDVNGTPLTAKGQFPVWDQANQYFDFDYNIWPDLISSEAYSGSWNGIDSIAPSKNAVYDKISTLESINYCAATMTVTTGTLNQGTVSDLCAVGGTDVIVQERVANPPFQIDFTFTGVIRLSGIKFYGRYNGGATHNVHVECYNYVSATWDYVGEFSSTTNKQWFAYNLNLPNNYLSSGAVQVRIIHQDTGINTHQMILDYINVNYGGGGGSGFITAGAVEFTPNGNIVATNVQAAIQELDVEKENLSNKENTTVDNSTIKYPTVNLLKTYADTKAPASGSGNYIQNQNAVDQAANSRISGNSKSNSVSINTLNSDYPFTIKGNNSNIGTYSINLFDSNDRTIFNVDNSGRMNLFDHSGVGGVSVLYNLGSQVNGELAGHFAYGAKNADGNPNTTGILANYVDEIGSSSVSSSLHFGYMDNKNTTAGYSQPNKFAILDKNGLALPSTPIIATTGKFSNLEDNNFPFHVSDAVGLSPSPMYRDGNNMVIGSTTAYDLLTIYGGFSRVYQTAGFANAPADEIGYISRVNSNNGYNAGMYFNNSFQETANQWINFKVASGGILSTVLTLNYDKAATFASTIQATTAKLTSLTDGYLPYHISDASGLGNSPLNTNGTSIFLNQTSDLTGKEFQMKGFFDMTDINNSQAIRWFDGSTFRGGIGSDSWVGGSLNDFTITSAGNLNLRTTTSALNRMTVEGSSGNVGIGYSTGTEITNNKLAVNGSGYFNGNLRLYNSSSTDISNGFGRSETNGNSAFVGWRYNGGNPYAFFETYASSNKIVLQSGNGGVVEVGNSISNNSALTVFGQMAATTGYLLNGNNLFSSLSSNVITKWDGTKFVDSGTPIFNYTVQSLSGTNVTWNLANGKDATITLTGNTVITLSNAINGISGTLWVTNPSTVYTITFAGYVNSIDPFIRLNSNVVITSGGSKSDDYTYKYNGTKMNWNGTLDRH